MARYTEMLKVRVQSDLFEELERIAIERDMKMSALLRKVLSNFIKRNTK